MHGVRENHSLGDDYIYALPPWIKRAYKEGGEWFSWHEYSSTPDNEGGLYIEIDRTQLDEMGKDLVMEIKFFDYDNASFYVELLTADYELAGEGAEDIYGNLMQGTLDDTRHGT